jgi:Spy/CpxP family protein refolding chaperone
MKLAWLTTLFVVALMCVGRPAHAEPANEDKRAKVEERLEKLRERVLKKELKLDNKRADAVSEILTRYFKERRKLMETQRENRQKLRKLIRSDSNDQEAYRKAIKNFRDGRKKLQALEDKQLDEVAKILTPKEQTKLVAALQRLRRKLAKKMANRD